MADRIDVTNELNQIAISIYGREMRSSIHDGIEKVANGMNEVGNEWDQKVADGDFNATIEVGAVITGAPGTGVSVVNSGTNAEAVLDFTIPRGDAGSIENATAIDIATSDGSNVQDKLNNSFSLGNAPEGTPYEQNISGFVSIENENLDTVVRSNLYHCETCIGRPAGSNGWMQVLGGTSNVKQIYHVTGDKMQATLTRTMVSGVWGSWKLTAGEIQLYSNSTGIEQGGSFTLPLHLSMFGSVRIKLSGQLSFAMFGGLNVDSRNVRASITDVDTSNNATIQIAVLTYSETSNAVTNARSSRQTRGAAGAATNTTLNIVEIVGLP